MGAEHPLMDHKLDMPEIGPVLICVLRLQATKLAKLRNFNNAANLSMHVIDALNVTQPTLQY